MLYNSTNIPAPVISLSIFASEEEISSSSSLLVTVRDPIVNHTHPNVISVPTQRIPPTLFADLLQSATLTEQVEDIAYFSSSLTDSQATSGHNPLIFVVESLLSRKLGVGEHLEAKSLEFKAGVSAVQTGLAHYFFPNLPKKEQEQSELISMMNIIVHIVKGAELFPAHSLSYSHIFWTEAEKFTRTFANKDTILVGLNPIDYCIHGLCVLSTYNVLAPKLGHEPMQSS